MVTVCLAALTGCVVQSIQPFYTASSRTRAPVTGAWTLVRAGGEDLSARSIRPWVFTSTDSTNVVVETFNKDNVRGELKAVFFRVGDRTFCDFLAGELGDEKCVNEFWVLTVRPVHTVCQVERKGDTLVLKPLSADWLGKALEKKEVSLPFLASPGDETLPLFTATSEEWQHFLKAQGANTNAFPDKIAYVLKERKANDQKDLPASK